MYVQLSEQGLLIRKQLHAAMLVIIERHIQKIKTLLIFDKLLTAFKHFQSANSCVKTISETFSNALHEQGKALYARNSRPRNLQIKIILMSLLRQQLHVHREDIPISKLETNTKKYSSTPYFSYLNHPCKYLLHNLFILLAIYMSYNYKII